MSNAAIRNDDEDGAELEMLAEAVAQSDCNPRTAPHEQVRAWLMRFANGEFDASAPEPH